MPRVARIAAALAASLVSTIVVAQQQVPPQHSPSTYEYKEAKKDRQMPTLDPIPESPGSNVTLTWYAIARAGRYLLKIARDPEMNQVFFTVETLQTTYITPPFAPGQYFYQVFGYEGERLVGQTTLQRFVVGKPVTVQSTSEFDKRILSAPAIIGPLHLETFPAHGKVRMSWEPVYGARGYRFRLWEEDKVKESLKFKREIKPRWTTEVEQSWIEFRDAPYASFMYLDSGTYRWDVAAINKEGAFVGDVATGYFKVSRQQFLKGRELYLQARYGFDPNVGYSESSTPTGQNNSLHSASHRLDIDADWWLGRQWGANFGFGEQTFSVQAPASGGPTAGLTYLHLNLDLLFRTYLSYEPAGWTLGFNAGMGLQEYPQVDNIGANQIHVSRPKAVGAHLGFRLERRWRSPWGMQILGNSLLQAFTLNGPTGSATTEWAPNVDLGLRVLYHCTEHFAPLFGITGEYRRLSYLPDPLTNASTVTIPAWYLLVGAQLHWF